MTRWIALLRGVNVNGRTIKSADLSALFGDLGFENVRTVLASGNVCFDTARADAAKLKRDIEAGLVELLGHEHDPGLVAEAFN
ncbi:DUF1697 domain-containing protein, partial [Rhizobium johnstonii]|uniref:DUF1697 domain-containing protein n=1 Tax=Rhizobium johnstonii TaxID=3019933 RepID=UPI003F9771CB